MAVAAVHFERRKAWVLALHEAWENDVDFAYLSVLQKPGAGAVKDPYVMVYPLSEHDWEASRQGLRQLARHIDALPDAGHPHWPALLPLTALRSSVDFDLRVQPPDDASPAAAFHARRVLATLLVNLKTLRRAHAELGRLVQWVVEAAPAVEARLADVSPQALAILDAVCAAHRSEEEREAGVNAAIAALDAADSGNFDAVRVAEDRAEKLEQRYRAFLKVLFRAVDGVDRARALHAETLANGVGGEPWLTGWSAIMEELDELLVRRVLGGRLELAPIACARGDALDTDLHNPLGAEPVPGVEKDQVWRVESRGFAYAEDGARRVVRPVDVIVAVPVSA
jgi:molecular chaperone GrpE (heat shock protein)